MPDFEALKEQVRVMHTILNGPEDRSMAQNVMLGEAWKKVAEMWVPQPQPGEAAVFLTLDELAYITSSLAYDRDMHDENSSTYKRIGVITEKMKVAYAKLKEAVMSKERAEEVRQVIN